MIKKYWAVILFGISLFIYLASFFFNAEKNEAISLSGATFPNGAYGYEIRMHGKLIISQDEIPCLPGHIRFKSMEDALKTGALAKSKMQMLHKFPTISLKELDSLGIETRP